MKQRDAGHTLKEEVKKKAMELKPELLAAHPETGKRHRWEIVEFLAPKRGDFFLGGEAVLPHGKKNEYAVRVCGCSGMPWGHFILRDLGPVEEKKSTLLDYDAFAKSICNAAAAYGQSIGDTTLQTVRMITTQPGYGAEVTRLKARIGELESAHRRIARRDAELVERNETQRETIGQLDAQIASLESQLTESRSQVTDLYRQRAEERRAGVNYVDRINELEKALESKEAAPLPVGVVRLPIGRTQEIGTFEILSPIDHPIDVSDVYHLDWFGGGWRIVCAWKVIDKEDLPQRATLLRLDAPEEKKTEKPNPAPCPHCGGIGSDPLDGRWECRKCDGTGVEKPAPPKPYVASDFHCFIPPADPRCAEPAPLKEEPKPGWGPYFDPLLRPTVRNIYLRPYSMTLDHC